MAGFSFPASRRLPPADWFMHRPERIAETLREEIAQIVGYELEDPRLATITVTEVRVADDLRDASVYVTVEGDGKDLEEWVSARRDIFGSCERIKSAAE